MRDSRIDFQGEFDQQSADSRQEKTSKSLPAMLCRETYPVEVAVSTIYFVLA